MTKILPEIGSKGLHGRLGFRKKEVLVTFKSDAIRRLDLITLLSCLYGTYTCIIRKMATPLRRLHPKSVDILIGTADYDASTLLASAPCTILRKPLCKHNKAQFDCPQLRLAQYPVAES